MKVEKSEFAKKEIRLIRIMATIPVTDIERAVSFYTTIFGMQKVFENGKPVGFVMLRQGDGVELGLSLNRKHRPSVNGPAHFLVNDADEVFARCEAIGARIIKGRRDQPYGLRDFIIADPDGNRLDIGSLLNG